MAGGQDGADEMDCSSFFDQIEDLLDFPADNIDGGLSGSLESFPCIWSESLPGSDSIFSNNAASDLSAELSVPYEDIVQLEWLSTFVEDSSGGAGGSLTMQKPNDAVNTKDLFHTTSPVSVLESSTASASYFSGKKPAPRCTDPSSMGKRVKARSKRSRPVTFNPRPAMQLKSPKAAGSSDSENYAESRPVIVKIAKKQLPNTGEEKKKKKKMKLTVTQPAALAEVSQEQPSQAVRKCLHCEITKTPQWRAGPLGPKTLCNACGVRYKSGRLFPEYRPAASPTFVPLVHSNSHKKVVEMRNKTCDSPTGARKSVVTTSTPPEMIPTTNVRLDYM